MTEHQSMAHWSRLVEEQAYVDGNLKRLVAFTFGEVFPTLDEVDKSLLLIQRAAMATYSHTLEARIRRVGK